MSLATSQTEIEYPDSDRQPLADNTLQFQWIVAITGSVNRIFQDDPNRNGLDGWIRKQGELNPINEMNGQSMR